MGNRGIEIQNEVLSALRKSLKALSAYEILRKLQQRTPSLAPQTIYRALSALMKCGKVHRIESLNAFISCRCSKNHQSSIFSICNDCGEVEEEVSVNLLKELSAISGKSGFSAIHHVIEIHGQCVDCSTQSMT